MTSTTQTKPALSKADRITIAAVISWDKGEIFRPDEVEAIKVTGDWVSVKLTGDRSYPIHKEQFKSILAAQKTQKPVDAEVEFVLNIERKLETAYNQNHDKIEVCGNGSTYEVWRGMTKLGSFYRDYEGRWVADSPYQKPAFYRTAKAAQNAVVAAAKRHQRLAA